MENKSSDFIKSALNHGLIFGVILVIIQLVLYMVNFMPLGIGKGLLSLAANLAIYIFGLWWFTKTYRDTVLGGYISYGNAFLYGFTVFIVASFIGAVYSYVFNAFIDPEYTSRVMKASADWTEGYMRSRGVPEAQISAALDRISSRKLPTAIGGAVRAFLISFIAGAIVSAISSAFAKKAENPFEEKNV